MEKYFATYNQSLALKELGFDEPCIEKFDTQQGGEWFLNIYSGHLNVQFNDKSKACIAPLKSQVFEWFRDNYNLISCIRTNIYGCTIDEQEFYYEIVSVRGVGSYSLYNKFEEAESECIDKLIEMVKNKL